MNLNFKFFIALVLGSAVTAGLMLRKRKTVNDVSDAD